MCDGEGLGGGAGGGRSCPAAAQVFVWAMLRLVTSEHLLKYEVSQENLVSVIWISSTGFLS